MTVGLDGVLRRYDWGSTTAIPALLGIEADGRPAAELWFGAHPDDPSAVVERGCTLEELIEADPSVLGVDVVDRFGPRLPFLLKVLAAGAPLSIQVHPNLAQARAGFAAENAAGVAQDASERNYRDANHKPELIVALTEFEALCGFRPVAQTIAYVRGLDVPELAFLLDLLRGPDPLRAAFTGVLTAHDPAVLVAAVSARLPADHPIARTAVPAFPGDIGIVLALLLNYVRLQPGEAIYLGAGNVHAYLGGLGVEIMAASDNVLRCGLTSKHIDVRELLAVTDFSELAEPRWPSTDGVFSVPTPDFQLSVLDVDGTCAPTSDGPRIVLCTSGSVLVDGIRLAPGHAAFAAAGDAAELTGTGRVFVAGVGS